LQQIAVVTPTHKQELTLSEELRLKITLHSNKELSHFFVLPQDINKNYYKKNFPFSKIEVFDSYYFESYSRYNSMMLLPEFYDRFSNFKYILLSQTDSFVVKDIRSISNYNFTYLGASWNPSFFITEIFNTIFVNRQFKLLGQTHELQSGNGGLSLRDPVRISQILKESSKSQIFKKILCTKKNINEDLLLVFLLKKNGILPLPRDTADKFFIETSVNFGIDLKDVYGYHALQKWNPGLEHWLLNKYSQIL
jgi:hypothetical protein